MTLAIWSYLLTFVGIVGLLFAGRKQRIGWLIGLLAQGLWAAYAVVSEQPGFLLSAFVYAFVYATNYWSWRTGFTNVTAMREAAEAWEKAEPLLNLMLQARRDDMFHADLDDLLDEAQHIINDHQRSENAA